MVKGIRIVKVPLIFTVFTVMKFKTAVSFKMKYDYYFWQEVWPHCCIPHRQ